METAEKMMAYIRKGWKNYDELRTMYEKLMNTEFNEKEEEKLRNSWECQCLVQSYIDVYGVE